MSTDLNLCFDGNYLFYKSMVVSNTYANKSKKFLSDIEEINVLVRKVATDFVFVLNKFPGYHKAIVVKDSSSWRKEYYPEYKGNRSKDSNIDWGNMFHAMDEFLEIIEKRGVIISTQQNAEGDDLMYLWANQYLENQSASTIIITGDSDLTQCVNYNDNTFTAVYNNNSKQRKFIVKNGFQNWLNSYPEQNIDIFSGGLDQIFKVSANEIIKTTISNIETIEIDPMKIALYKAICGDDGDNIPSIYSWLLESGKIRRVTKVHLEKLYDLIISQFNEVNMYDLMNNYAFRNFVRVQIQSLAKIKIPQNEWETNLDRNIKLSFLDKTTIPQYIQDDFIQLNQHNDNFKTDSFNNIDLLKDTKFAKFNNISNVFNM